MTMTRHRLAALFAGFGLVAAVLVGSADAAPVPPGPVVSWGHNPHGQLGDGTTADRFAPVTVCAVGQTAPCPGQLTNVVQVVAGDDDISGALLADGTVVTWGNNERGALGDGTLTERHTPVRVCAVGAVAPCTSFLSGV